MFSNSKFSLDYDTMSNQEIMDLHIERISKNGNYLLLSLRFSICLDFEHLNEHGIRNDVAMGVRGSWLDSVGQA